MITFDTPTVSTVTVLLAAAVTIAVGALLAEVLTVAGGTWAEVLHTAATRRWHWSADMLRACVLLSTTALVAGVVS